MRRVGQILAVITMLTILCMNIEITALATEPSAENVQEELTEAEIAEKEAENAAYEMTVESNDWANWPLGPGTYGEAAIIMEAGTGAILYEKNIDSQQYPASITKVLTALVALENGQLMDTVTFSHDSVAFLQPGDSSVGLKEGNQISLEQGLYATLLASANEAAYAVGESVGINAGYDYHWFLEQMNTRCRELGGENSNFVNTNGLHDSNHYTCARDMALIGREIFKHPEFFTIVQTQEYTIPASETTEEHVFQQKHKMLRPDNSNYYEYAVGGKTGYTSDALSTLITMADNGDMKLICVVLRTHGNNMYQDTRNLFDYVYSNFHKIVIADYEDSEDVEEIVADENSGYVVLPDGIAFEDLEMTIIPDDGIGRDATLEYRYEDNLLGMARATVSQTYIDKHSAQVKSVEKDNETDIKDSDTEKIKKIILICACVLLIILIAAFINLLIRRKRRCRKRKNS